jgi:hypothetical protein
VGNHRSPCLGAEQSSFGEWSQEGSGSTFTPMSWATASLDSADPRKLYGQKVEELYRTLKKIQ